MLERLGSAAGRGHHWWVIGAWVAALVILGVVAGGAGGHTKDVFTIPGTHPQRAVDVLSHDFPTANDATAQIVFHAPSGSLTTPAASAAIAQTVAGLQHVNGVATVTNPTNPLFASSLAPDHSIGFATVVFRTETNRLPHDTLDQLRAAVKPATAAGLQVRMVAR